MEIYFAKKFYSTHRDKVFIPIHRTRKPWEGLENKEKKKKTMAQK